MLYTIQELAKLAGVSSRTLRYYDEINLLKPAQYTNSGYRLYGPGEVDRLQIILFYKELGFQLEIIQSIVSDPDFDRLQALKTQRLHLQEKQQQIEKLLQTVERTISMMKGETHMADLEKFEGFKRQMVAQNERSYGDEIRKKYGDTQINESNAKVMNLTKDDYEAVTKLEQDLFETLSEAYKTGNPASELSQKAAELHMKWLCYFWPTYSTEAHANLAQMYVEDDRFRAHYDREQPGTAEFLRDAIKIYTGQN